mgnify:CR=1 FL=1
MQFNIKIWTNIYNKVNALGKQLKESMPDWDGNPPIAPMSTEEQAELRSQIKTLSQKSDTYLDQCGMRMPRPLWAYKLKDPTTWASDPSFAYEDFLVA